MNEQQFAEKAKKLIGLRIDTNERKYEPVTECTCYRALEWLIETDRLHHLRRLAPGSSCFTAYTYHGGTLQETLQDYLNADQ